MIPFGEEFQAIKCSCDTPTAFAEIEHLFVSRHVLVSQCCVSKIHRKFLLLMLDKESVGFKSRLVV